MMRITLRPATQLPTQLSDWATIVATARPNLSYDEFRRRLETYRAIPSETSPVYAAQIMRRYNEAIASDYVIPYRILEPTR